MKSELRRAIDGRPARALGAGGIVTAPGGAPATTASNVAIVDAGGYFDAVEVESALQEVGAALALLDDAIANLEGGDTLARTGFTVLSHGTPLALALEANGKTLSVQDDIFALNEIVVVSNVAGQIEYMRIDSAATAVTGPNGVMYQHSVTRRYATNPPGVTVGWARGTLANGLTDRGYILVDGRHDMSLSSPQLSAVRWRDAAQVLSERVFRLGNLYGVAGVTAQEFGFAVGNLTTNDVYLLFNGDREQMSLRNADIVMIDPQSGADAVRMWGKGDGERLAGDYVFGTTAGVHTDFYGGDGGRWTLYRGDQPLIDVDGERSYLAGMFTIGEALGARAELGEQDGRAMILLRNDVGVVKVALTTDASEDVFAHIGNPAPQPNRMTFDGATGVMDVDGVIRARAMYVHGVLTIADDGRMEFVDPEDPLRKGVIDRRGQRGYSVDALGQQYLSSVDAWGPLTLENRPGSGIWKTWLAGEMMRGDPDFRHFRVERGANGRAGLFNGETPVVYVDYNGDGHFTGQVYTGEGNIGGWGVESARLTAPGAYVTLDSQQGIMLDVQDNTEDAPLEDISDPASVFRAVTFVDGASVVHRLYATKRIVDAEAGTESNALILQAQPVNLGTRAEAWFGATSGIEARTVLRALGGYNTAGQQNTTITLWAYRGDGSGAPFGYRRIDLDADAVQIAPYTGAAEPGGAKPDGLLLYSDGTWDPGLGEGLYLYSNGAWIKVAGPRDGSMRWGDATNYAQVDGDGILTFEGVARLQPRYGNETKAADFTASTLTYYRVNTTGGAVTVTLPTAVGRSGRVYVFKLIGGSNALTLDPNGSETIDGSSTWSTTTLYGKVTIISNGTNWEIIA